MSEDKPMNEALDELLRLADSAKADAVNFELAYRGRERELVSHLPALTELHGEILANGLQSVEHATADQLEALLRAVAFAAMHGTMIQTNQSLSALAEVRKLRDSN